MRCVCKLTVRTECRVCGVAFERPTTADGLCLGCATRGLTRRQVEVLRAYRGHRPGCAPTRVLSYLNAASGEQRRGVRLSGLVRVIRRLRDDGWMECDDLLVVNSAHLTRAGYNAVRRMENEDV